jgi:menaquinone reductase, multiheme cytochrome c subunit
VNIRGLILFAAGLAAALGAGWAGFPRVIHTSRTQPVDFSHKVHADKAGAKCEDCHAFREDGTYAGIPTLDKCAGCHAAAMGTTAAEKDFIEKYVTPQREPQWLSYARQPENVFFSHVTHVKRGQVKCESCHGGMGSSDQLPPYQEDRISGYSRDIWGTAGRPGMTMNDCIACHGRERHKGNREDSCLDCHK